MMRELFSHKKMPHGQIDEFIFAVYGNPPPAKRANVSQAVSLASELLMNMVDEQEVHRRATALSDGPIPYSTHDLAIATALDFFTTPEHVPQLVVAQFSACMKVLEWHRAGLALPVFASTFEDGLYQLYKPGR
jgi:hypothetical protein